MGYDILPEIDNYQKYADQKISQTNHGGVVAYVHVSLVAHVFDIQYETCYVSFRLDFAPSFIFVGAYIQPESSKYFSTELFGALSRLLISSNERNLTPVLGGDLNCRFGDLNKAFYGNKVLYDANIDAADNFNGRNFGIDLCNACHIFPLNHLKYKNKTFQGNFTYHKSNKKSQIDFAFTNCNGLPYIEDFNIIDENWHSSDHLPISMKIQLPEAVHCSFLLKRAKELNYEFDPYKTQLKRFLSTYDEARFNEILLQRSTQIENSCKKELTNDNFDAAFAQLERNITDIYRVSKAKKDTVSKATSNTMYEANTNFNNLQKCISGDIDGDIDELFEIYQSSRNAISKEIFQNEHKRWKELVSAADSKKLWNSIDWKGDMCKKVSQPPVFDDLTLFFEDLYKGDANDLLKIDELNSDISNPTLDGPITKDEMDTALNQMKKGGYDHKIQMFRLIVNALSPLILLLLNIMFSVAYPVTLAISLLTAIPKKGNLSLASNYRGIQMLPALAVLFDRIIANRLLAWLGVHHVQSAFQKAKSTIHQLFTIRLLIEIANATDTTLYIGMFDLAKAFDKVSRYLLLKNWLSEELVNVCWKR